MGELIKDEEDKVGGSFLGRIFRIGRNYLILLTDFLTDPRKV